MREMPNTIDSSTMGTISILSAEMKILPSVPMTAAASPSQSPEATPSKDPSAICQLSESSLRKQKPPKESRSPTKASCGRPERSSAQETATPAPTAIPQFPLFTPGEV